MKETHLLNFVILSAKANTDASVHAIQLYKRIIHSLIFFSREISRFRKSVELSLKRNKGKKKVDLRTENIEESPPLFRASRRAA